MQNGTGCYNHENLLVFLARGPGKGAAGSRECGGKYWTGESWEKRSPYCVRKLT